MMNELGVFVLTGCRLIQLNLNNFEIQNMNTDFSLVQSGQFYPYDIAYIGMIYDIGYGTAEFVLK